MTEERGIPAQEPGRNRAESPEAQGWLRRFTIETARVDEYIELYESLGEEVRVEPVAPELMAADDCATCLLAAGDRFRIIYTRPRV